MYVYGCHIFPVLSSSMNICVYMCLCHVWYLLFFTHMSMVVVHSLFYHLVRTSVCVLVSCMVSHILYFWSANHQQEQQLEEQHKYGIYFDDEYDYLQHLKDVNELPQRNLQEVCTVPDMYHVNPATVLMCVSLLMHVGLHLQEFKCRKQTTTKNSGQKKKTPNLCVPFTVLCQFVCVCVENF